jgi:hypothetical protein
MHQISIAEILVTRENAVMKSKIYGLLLPLVGLLTSCAPELGVRMRAPALPEPTAVADAAEVTNPVRVRVGEFIDSRPTQALVAIDGRKVMTEGSPAELVEDGFVRYLKQAGARIAVLNSPSIEGEIVEWTAVVASAFPTSEARASARLRVMVRDSRAHPIYRATFTGESTTSHPMIDQEIVKNVLGQAMGSAIEAAVRDPEFVAQLSKGRID